MGVFSNTSTEILLLTQQSVSQTLEEIGAEIDARLEKARKTLEGGNQPKLAASELPKKRKKRRLSAAGRRAIVEALKVRWAKAKAAKKK